MKAKLTKLFTLLTILLFGFGQVWAEDFTITPITGSYLSPGNLVKITYTGDLKTSSTQIQTTDKNKSGVITLTAIAPGVYLKSASFTDANWSTATKRATLECTSGGSIVGVNGVYTFTASDNATTATISVTAGTSGAAKLGSVSLVVTNGTTNDIETYSTFAKTGNDFSFTAQCNGASITPAAALSSSTWTVSSNNISAPSSSDSKTITISSDNNIKFIALYDSNCRLSLVEKSSSGGTCDGASWSVGSTPTKSVTFKNGIGTSLTITKVFVITEAASKHSVIYDLNGGTGTTPTQADVAEGAKFTLHDGVTDITAPAGQKFDGWHDGTTKYAGGAEYTMGESNVTLTAQWVENVPDPTASFADATYIIGQSALDMSAKFTSNSSGSVTYSLKEATSDASITSAGSFTATAAGTYVVVASQEAVAGTYAAISKEATVTVLDNELSDIFIWNKNSSHGGDGKCVTAAQANQNVNANQASTTLDYSSLTMSGITTMGRATTANTDVELTFTAEQEGFAIKSICAFGKLEEPGGAEYSWDNGTTWTTLAQYNDQVAKTFNAPAGEFPETFKLRFTSVNTGSGGLWWRNALVTLEMKKTVSGVTEALVGAEVNGAAISSENLATLLEDKTLDIATAYATAPTVTFVKQVTTSYDGGWADDVTSVDVEVAASDNTTAWSASATINSQEYTVTLAKPAGPSLETEATAFTLTSAKVATDTKKFTFSGVNLTSGNVTISLESPVAGMTVSPAEVTPTAGAITDQEVTITYKSLEAVAEANVNLVVYYDADTKITIPLTYSSTVGYEDLTPISAATTWNWDGAASAAYGTLGQNDMIILANADVTWDEGFNARAIAGALQHYYRDGKYAQGNSLKFNTTIPGKVYVKFSNTGGKDIARAPRITDANGTYAPTDESEGSKNTTAIWYNHSVAAGDVLIEGFEMKDPIALNMLRYYEVRFVPVFAVTYDAGEGSVKGGETMPTQADEAAGEKIILAAATALEKDGYDFAGWLCNIDAQTYQPGDEYTMTAAATTFTAQWVLHVDPVDPTLTYDDGDYMVGSAALDLSSLITEKTSTGAITYSVKDAGTTGAAIDGNNFTATAAGTATITASQAAVLGYNAKTVDFSVVVTEATEIDGIKLVEAGALTGNFVTARTLSNGENTVEGIAYTKYLTMNSTMTSFGNEVAPSATKGIYYYPSHKNIRFYFYVYNNQSSAKKIYIYTVDEDAESTSDATSANVSVDAGRHLVYADVELTKHAAVVFGVENTGTQICQIVAVESGDELLQGGEAGYSIDYNKCYISPKAGTVAVYDGIEYKLYADAKLVSATNVQLQTLGTHYIKFHLDAPMTVNVYADNKKYYIGSECSTDDAAMIYEATGDGEFSLADGDWYINGSGVQVKINKLAFSAPKCEQPTVVDMENIGLCEGDAFTALTVSASVTDGGTLHYQWYKHPTAGDDVAVGTDAASYTPEADGQYYVVVTNKLTGFADNSKTSNTVAVEHFASADITTAPLNQRATAGNNVTLNVAATGKNVAYKWYTCDEDGTNEVALDPEQTGTSIQVTITAGLLQWYKVKVTSDCGNAEAMAKVEEFVPATPANVTESIVWDWKSTTAGFPTASNSHLDFANTSVEELFADVDAAMPNNAEFRSDMLYGIGQYAWRNKSDGEWGFQGFQIRFHSDVAGLVRVYFRAPSSGQTSVVTIDGKPAGSRGNSWGWSEYVEVPAAPTGDGIVIAMTNGETGMTRVQKIEFYALGHSRDVTPGNLGTLCLPNNFIARGVDVFELAGKEATYGKIVFADLEPDDLLDAGQAYIFQVNEATARFYYAPGEPVDAPLNNTALKGNLGATITFQPNSPEAENVYFVKDHALWSAKETGVTIGQYRAYLQMDAVSELANPNPAPGRRYIMLGTNGQNQAQGIDDVQDDVRSTKMLIDGRLFILRGEKIYDATGRLVK